MRVLLTIAFVLALAAPARAAEVEPLDNLGEESYFAFVERAETSGPTRRRPRSRSASSPAARPRARMTLSRVIARTTDERVGQGAVARAPNGTTGWVPASALSELQPVDTWLKIDTKAFKVTLIKKGKTSSARGSASGSRSGRRPKGQFYIRAKLEKYGGKGSVFGPLAFITSATSPTLTDWPGGGIVGVHGTNTPNLIPGRISHGCVRLRNADILKLAKLMPVGTPLTIS